MSTLRPYISLGTRGQQKHSQPQPISVPLAAAPKVTMCPGPLLLGSMLPCASSAPQHCSAATGTVESKTVSCNPHHGPAGQKKVSSLYVPCLSNNLCWAASETSSGVARDPAQGTPPEAASTRAPARSLDSCTAGTGKAPPAPPPDPPKLLFDIRKDAGGGVPASLGTRASFPDAVRPLVLGPQGTSDPENRRSREPSLLQPCSPAKARK